jgi:hypothetical protein
MDDREIILDIDTQIAGEERRIAFWINQISVLPEGTLANAAKQAAYNAKVSLEHLRECLKMFDA